MEKRPSAEQLAKYKSNAKNESFSADVRAKFQSIVDKFENVGEAVVDAIEQKKERKPRTTKTTTKVVATKQTKSDIESAKAEIKKRTGKTEEECESIVEEYRTLRTKSQERKKKEVQSTADNKDRVDKLKKDDKIISGTNEKTADAVIETTTKDVAEKIVKELDKIEQKAEVEATKEVKKEMPKESTTEQNKAIAEKTEEKVKEIVKTKTKRILIDTSDLLTSIAESLGKFDKDSQKLFLIKLRSDIDKLLTKFSLGGATMGATQGYNITQSNMSSSSVNPTMFGGGGGVNRKFMAGGMNEDNEYYQIMDRNDAYFGMLGFTQMGTSIDKSGKEYVTLNFDGKGINTFGMNQVKRVFNGGGGVGNDINKYFNYSQEEVEEMLDYTDYKDEILFTKIAESDNFTYYYVLNELISNKDKEEQKYFAVYKPSGRGGDFEILNGNSFMPLQDEIKYGKLNYQHPLLKRIIQVRNGGGVNKFDGGGDVRYISEEDAKAELEKLADKQYISLRIGKDGRVQMVLQKTDRSLVFAVYRSYDSYADAFRSYLYASNRFNGGGGVGGKNLDSIKNEYLENEDNNYHSENIVLLAKHFGTDNDYKEALRILSIHNKEGHLFGENSASRRKLSQKLTNKARKEMAKQGIEFKRGGGVNSMMRSRKFNGGGGVHKLLSDKFEEVGYETYARNFGVVQVGGFNNDKDINVLVCATIINMLDATGDEQFEEKPFTISIETHAYPKFWSNEYVDNIKDMVGEDDIDARGLDYLSDANSYGLGVPLSTDADNKQFETEEEAINFLNSKKLNDQISGLGMLSGFHFDKPYNRIGNMGWDLLYEQIGVNKGMKRGGGVGEELMGGQPNSSKPSGYTLIKSKGREIIVTDDGGKTQERWIKNNGYSGYTLRYNGNQYEFTDSFAKGGLTEHALKVGDTIMGEDRIRKDEVIVIDSNKNTHYVNLDKGQRFNNGGGVDSMMRSRRGMKFNGGGGVDGFNGYDNSLYLRSLTDTEQYLILKNIANHYEITQNKAYAEVTDVESEALYEYVTDKSLRMKIYNDMKNGTYGGYVIADNSSEFPMYYSENESKFTKDIDSATLFKIKKEAQDFIVSSEWSDWAYVESRN